MNVQALIKTPCTFVRFAQQHMQCLIGRSFNFFWIIYLQNENYFQIQFHFAFYFYFAYITQIEIFLCEHLHFVVCETCQHQFRVSYLSKTSESDGLLVYKNAI